MKEFHPVLEKTPLFEGIHMEDLSAMLGCIGGRTLSVPKGSGVLREGDPASHVGLVLSGAVRLERADYYGNRSIVAHMGPGELFGETYACAGVQALPISAVADTDSTVLLMDCRRITTTCSSACAFHSRIIYNLLRLVAVKNLVYDQKIQITSRRSTRDKLMAYLRRQARLQGSNEFTIPLDRQGLADYLGVERSAMSTELGKLCRNGLIECKKSWFKLL